VVNDLRELMRENVAAPPPDHLDVVGLVRTGRRRVRSRRAAVVGGTAAVVAAVVAATSIGLSRGSDRAEPSEAPPHPDAPTITLGDATQAVEGTDYRVLASYTNDNLDRGNGQYFDGVTDDGLVLFRDGRQAHERYALMDPTTGAKDWLPDAPFGEDQPYAVELGADRLVLIGYSGMSMRPTAYVFDRGTREWSTVEWAGLPRGNDIDAFGGLVMGPDGRAYVRVPATQGKPPEGGWPTGNGGEADDSNAEGDTYHLWSASLTDPADVRDEGLTVGDVAFTDTAMVWTDSRNGAAGLVHVRDLATGEEHSFDPHNADRCNLLSFGATDDRVVMGQYCGDYDDGAVRDDRVQILTTDGDQVVTVQDSGIDGGLAGGVVEITSYEKGRAGTYVYDLATDRLLRLSEGVGGSRWVAARRPPASSCGPRR
jgi:hypothetical protein